MRCALRKYSHAGYAFITIGQMMADTFQTELSANQLYEKLTMAATQQSMNK